MTRAQVRIVSVKTDGAIPAMLEVTWAVSPPPDDGKVSYAAAAPCTRGASFDGSCLPFANETMAMQGGSRGQAEASEEGTYRAKIAMPNAYYAGLGTKYVPPAIHVSYVSRNETFRGSAKVANGVPFRTITYPSSRTGPEFYLKNPKNPDF